MMPQIAAVVENAPCNTLASNKKATESPKGIPIPRTVASPSLYAMTGNHSKLEPRSSSPVPLGGALTSRLKPRPPAQYRAATYNPHQKSPSSTAAAVGGGGAALLNAAALPQGSFPSSSYTKYGSQTVGKGSAKVRIWVKPSAGAAAASPPAMRLNTAPGKRAVSALTKACARR